jgi:hypothetical protein
MMSTIYQYRPSKRPSVKQVQEWDLLFEDSVLDHWRGSEFDCTVEVWNGYPFPDFYKVVVIPHAAGKKKYSKLFYGESAHNDTERFVYDLGFHRMIGVL